MLNIYWEPYEAESPHIAKNHKAKTKLCGVYIKKQCNSNQFQYKSNYFD